MELKQLETEEEIKGKAKVHWQAWKEAYTGLIDQLFLDARSLEASEQSARRALKSGYRTIIAEEDNRVIGFADYGPYRTEDLKDAGEIYAIYLLKAYYGKGIGSALMSKALNELNPYRMAAVWVLEGNVRAVRFYEKFGFRADGSAQDLLLGTPVREIRMIRNCSGNNQPKGSG